MRDGACDGVLCHERIAVAELAGVVDLDRHAGEFLDPVLANERGVPGSAAAEQQQFGHRLGQGVVDVQLAEINLSGLSVHAAHQAVANGGGLLVDLFEHEVLVAALLGGDGIPCDALGLDRDRFTSDIRHHDRLGRDHRELSVVEEDDVARVAQHGGHIGSDEVLSVAHADDQGRPLARSDELVGFVGRGDDQRVDPLKLTQCASDRSFEVALVVARNEVGDDFSVGL